MVSKMSSWPVTTAALILGMLVLPVFPQNEPPPTTGDTSEVPDDIAEWMKRAEQGDADAQYRLGVMYNEGQEVPQDYKEAVRWWRAAAEQGLASSQNNLGVMYDEGRGVPQDYIQAHMWYNLAASDLTGDHRERSVKNRDELAAKMTAQQIAEAQRLAREWKPKTGSQ
ncbi:MAG: tetratricopeptide repeat protein [Acidobacteria bacterium]|nr:tetratricopeptide repeat protein [Acidobacteriota bacterium]